VKKLLIISLCVFLSSCDSTERSDDPITFGNFPPIVINITLPAYSKLQLDGNYIVLKNEGNRGIIVYRENSTTFRAFEQNCSFQPNDACATVQPFSIYMQDACCGSTFNYAGDPTGGLAWRPLGQYETHISGTTLTITDAVINY
jgi:hypothetical protein